MLQRGYLLVHFFMRDLVRKHSRVGNPEFFRTDGFPWVSGLEADWLAIAKELESVLGRVDELPDFRTISPQSGPLARLNAWKIFVLFGYGRKSLKNCRLCPRTAAALESIPGMKTAFFSILAPGATISPHQGPYAGVLRCHLALKVPTEAGKCRIKVGDSTRSWEAGKCLVFDDTFMHDVANGTDEARIVLFIDFKRPLPFFVDLLNEVMLKLISRVSLMDEYRNQVDWEKAFHR